jgi:hypothetical protein
MCLHILLCLWLLSAKRRSSYNKLTRVCNTHPFLFRCRICKWEFPKVFQILKKKLISSPIFEWLDDEPWTEISLAETTISKRLLDISSYILHRTLCIALLDRWGWRGQDMIGELHRNTGHAHWVSHCLECGVPESCPAADWPSGWLDHAWSGCMNCIGIILGNFIGSPGASAAAYHGPNCCLIKILNYCYCCY